MQKDKQTEGVDFMKNLRTKTLLVLIMCICTAMPANALKSQIACCGTTYHVSCSAPNASDSNAGTLSAPFLTIRKAAEIMQPGDTVIIHEGVYREKVSPARGGTSWANMITYRAAEGEKVVIKGSDEWAPVWKPSEYIKTPDAFTWQATLSPDMFKGANFFALINLRTDRLRDFIVNSEKVRGCIFLNGKPVHQVSNIYGSSESFTSIAEDESAFWVEENGLTIHLKTANNVDPNSLRFEITTREQVFAPEAKGVDYIAIEGLELMHAANSLPSPGPLKGLLGSNGGRHWRISGCDISYANTIGMEQGSSWEKVFGNGILAGHLLDSINVHDCDLSGLSDLRTILKRNFMSFLKRLVFVLYDDPLSPDKFKDFSLKDYTAPAISSGNVSVPIENVALPDGTTYKEWETESEPTAVYHVAQNAPNASDSNDGSESNPFLTINKAAQVLMPGETVIVHEGVYRECVDPARGGSSADSMIWYRTAEGEKVVIKGSDEWRPEFTVSDGGRNPLGMIWQAKLTGDMFESANVFCLKNQRIDAQWGWCQGAENARGQIFLDGKPLYQVSEYSQLLYFGLRRNVFWVSSDGMTVHIRLKDGSNPNGRNFEITTREQVFAPKTRYLNYIGVSGFEMYHAANSVPIPYPQKGLLSANAGNHWIIEDCTVGYANTVGIDLGGQWWYYGKGESQGSHIVRRCTIHDVGVCGIAAWHNMENPDIVIEDNLLYDCGTMNVAGHAENGAIKIHSLIDSVVRRNVILNTWFGSSIWLDGETVNTRVTQNVCIGNRDGWGQIFLEAYDGPYLVDNNIMYDVTTYKYSASRQSVNRISALYCHNAGTVIGVNNLMLDGVGSAVKFIDNESGAYVGNNRAYANIISEYEADGKVISLGNTDSISDFNLFTAPREELLMHFNRENKSLGWDEWNAAGMDRGSVSTPIAFTIDEYNLTLSAVSDGTLPKMPAVKAFLPGLIGSDGVDFDLMSNPRSDGEWGVGPLTALPLDGTVISIDPRCSAQ